MKRRFKSEHGSWLNCTPNSGPLSRPTVLGAGGKMGSGIAWVLLRAMADLDAQAHGTPGSGRYELVLIDGDRTAFPRLREYLRGQLRKGAEKNISHSKAYPKCGSR